MYLAEDRILCFEIVTKKREGWMYVVFFFFNFKFEHSSSDTA